jgi:hypothetical protein
MRAKRAEDLLSRSSAFVKKHLATAGPRQPQHGVSLQAPQLLVLAFARRRRRSARSPAVSCREMPCVFRGRLLLFPLLLFRHAAENSTQKPNADFANETDRLHDPDAMGLISSNWLTAFRGIRGEDLFECSTDHPQNPQIRVWAVEWRKKQSSARSARIRTTEWRALASG